MKYSQGVSAAARTGGEFDQVKVGGARARSHPRRNRGRHCQGQEVHGKPLRKDAETAHAPAGRPSREHTRGGCMHYLARGRRLTKYDTCTLGSRLHRTAQVSAQVWRVRCLHTTVNRVAVHHRRRVRSEELRPEQLRGHYLKRNNTEHM